MSTNTILSSSSSDSTKNSLVIERPWGSYESIALGTGYQVKRIIVKPKQQLSLQRHHHRSEHWVIADGEAIVTRNKEVITLEKDQHIYLPKECIHRVSNPNKNSLLILIEVQLGDYLGEDDIVRLEDDYGRV